MNPKLTFVCLLICSAAGASAQTQPGDPAYWRGESDGYQIDWTRANLAVSNIKDKKILFNARETSRQEWQRIQRESSGEPGSTHKDSAEWDYKLLSAVGPILSLEQSEMCDCGGAHPSENSEFVALNLGKTTAGKPAPATLTDYFAPNDIYHALMNDKLVQAAIKTAKPSNLTDLLKVLGGADGHFEQGDCEYVIGEQFLENFALYDYKDGLASVRLSVSQAEETCRGNYIQLGILLPVTSAQLKSALALAAEGRRGILMKTIGKPKDRVTTFSYH